MIVYKITNLVDGKLYIGITTKTIEKRWSNHIAISKREKKFELHKAMSTQGVEFFKIEQIAIATSIEELDVLERKYIAEYNSKYPNGYNLTAGGKGACGHKRSEKTKEILRNIKRKPVTDETRKKLSESLTGRVMSKDAVEKSRLARIGKKRNDEQKQLMSLGRVGKCLKNDYARKHPKEMVNLAINLLKQNKKQTEIVKVTGLTQSYISNLKTKKRGQAILGA